MISYQLNIRELISEMGMRVEEPVKLLLCSLLEETAEGGWWEGVINHTRWVDGIFLMV